VNTKKEIKRLEKQLEKRTKKVEKTQHILEAVKLAQQTEQNANGSLSHTASS
jgi:excinuclease UvrABC helicase subunit UvrB